MITILDTTESLKSYIKNRKIGFVPTMGALHEGHLSLVREAKKQADYTLASIFVNPAQFAAHEDLDRYPRQEQQDIALLEQAGADAVFLPKVSALYPEGFSTTIHVGPIGQILEGEVRPHFFDGVALVVTKLLLLVEPTVAVFGEKDYQQLIIIKKLVNELNLNTVIVGAPIIRDPDGLAMSSRNAYLTASERKIAPLLYRVLHDTMLQLKGPSVNSDAILLNAKEKLLTYGFSAVDYIALCDANTLNPLINVTAPARLLAAARLDSIRLIDNVPILF